MHDVFVRDVAVGEDHLVGAKPADERSEFLFRVDRNAFGIQRTRQEGRVHPSLQVGNLGGGECHYLILWTFPEINVEVMEVAAAGTEDDDPGARPRPPPPRELAGVPRAALTSSDLRHRRHRNARLPAWDDGSPLLYVCSQTLD